MTNKNYRSQIEQRKLKEKKSVGRGEPYAVKVARTVRWKGVDYLSETWHPIQPYYAILRSIPHKVGGVIAMGSALVVLLLLPFINTSEIRSSTFRPLFKKFY